MTKYRKKPVVVEAVQYTGDNHAEACEFLGADHIGTTEAGVFIRTIEGEMRAPIGHWLIRGVKGEHYGCAPDVFAATYEPADSPTGRTTFDWEDRTTWPPEDELVMLFGRGGHRRGLRALYLDEDEPVFYDEDNDLDDGIEPGDELSWEALP